MAAFGSSVCVGIHDDASYAALKGAPPVDTLEARMARVRAPRPHHLCHPGDRPHALHRGAGGAERGGARTCCSEALPALPPHRPLRRL